ncbi:TPA: DEAD/DEAH box helicase [Candidatus Woesearchaeota archaeon]|nr:DEAD/DEAH box helicase [Candidatus Woesearchaeota archaeon]HII68823.1 DEAD/DEAH box helicase [Candidatus Woesearchaeota archaeon]
MNFNALGLSPQLLEVISEKGFENPSPIQENTIPHVLQGRDVIGLASTGSGKTLAFGAGIIEHTTPGNGIQALVLVPTRELAEQVGRHLTELSRNQHLLIEIVYGGVGIEPQIAKLPKADVVVGTPGRLLDHLERRTLNLSKVRTLVLDEADRMLDMGFIDDVRRIMSQCPKDGRQTLLFSATMAADIKVLTRQFMHEPVEIRVDSYVDPSKLKQVYYAVPDNLKFSLLVHLLRQEHAGLVMVFCNTRVNADLVEKNLLKNKIEAMAIHGGLSQARRSKIMEKFNTKDVYVLIATDVAARGLDIPDVSHVYNYDIPTDPKQYIHRVGRTARAGADGIAVNILASRDHDNFRAVLWDNREMRIEKLEMPYVERVFFSRDSPEGRDGFRRGGFTRGSPRGGDQQRWDAPRHGNRERSNSQMRSGGKGYSSQYRRAPHQASRPEGPRSS